MTLRSLLTFAATCAMAVTAALPARQNPLLQLSDLPYHYPPFDRITLADYGPAFDAAMAEQLREVKAIAENPDRPTFDNTIVAMDRSGRLLNQVQAIFGNMAEADTNPQIDRIQSEYAPRLSAHTDEIQLNPRLFARIHALFAQRAQLGLDSESLRLLERYHRDFVRAGALLTEPQKNRIRAINAELAALSARYGQNVLNEQNASAITVERREDLDGLSAEEISAAAEAAKTAHLEGKYVIRLLNTTGQPPLASLRNRALRERIMRASLARGTRGGKFDNRQLTLRMVQLRAERAQLKGYSSHAAFVVEPQMSRTVDAVNHLLARLGPPTVAAARREAAAMQAVIDAEHGGFPLAAWDWDFYSEKVRLARYTFDESQLKPYFELNRVLVDGVFYAAHELYGISFKERHDLPVYEPDVRVFEVFDRDGSHLGILLEDFYARPSKHGGAWMNEYVLQNDLLGDTPVVGNHHNIPRPEAGHPTLLTFDEVTTLFHEFGHGLHGLFSRVKYPTLAGTNVARDFVEYPSQVNEMWAAWPEVVRHYAHHYQTGAPMPQALLDKMLATQKFNQGYATLEYLEAATLDQAWHQLGAQELPADLPRFESETLRRFGMEFAPVPPRYRTTYFNHAFSPAAGYSANYYSYIWADVLVADSIEWFKTHGGLLRANGDHFRQTLLSQGNRDEPMTLYRNFTGHEPDIGPFLRRRGLDEGAAASEGAPPAAARPASDPAARS